MNNPDEGLIKNQQNQKQLTLENNSSIDKIILWMPCF